MRARWDYWPRPRLAPLCWSPLLVGAGGGSLSPPPFAALNPCRSLRTVGSLCTAPHAVPLPPHCGSAAAGPSGLAALRPSGPPAPLSGPALGRAARAVRRLLSAPLLSPRRHRPMLLSTRQCQKR
eukprot:15455727-Alexandrium_andersonii.AAC.1